MGVIRAPLATLHEHMRLPAARRRRQLLDVARELFAMSGFHATSMDDVAEAAGVTKPVLYQHFPSKRDLYLELLEDVGAHILAEIAEATGRVVGGRARVEAGFTAYFRYVAANRAAFRVLFGASVRNDREFATVADRIVAGIADTIAELIDVDVPAEQRRVLAHAVVGIAEATSRRALNDEGAEDDPEQLARWTTELAWYGLRGIRS
jgi:AcrR family transcriptional regulator